MTKRTNKILLVEDDVQLAERVTEFLQSNDCEVHCVYDGKDVLTTVNAFQPDLVLLDWMLPGMDGLSICRLLQETNASLPVIMLTAREEELDEVLGLEVGAADYLTKPVRPRVLLARIQKVLKQTDSQPSSFKFGGLLVEPKANRVSFYNQEISLTTKEFQLLVYLARHAGEVKTRDAVYRALKGREFDGLERSLDVTVSSLRQKFEVDPKKPTRIKTVWGKGYLFVPDAWSMA